MEFLWGFATGMVLGCTLGSVVFALIKISMDYGVRSGIFMVTGVVASDVGLIALCLFPTALLPDIQEAEFGIRLLGGLFLTAWGLKNLFVPRRINPEIGNVPTRRGFLGLFVTGALLNMLNPNNLLGWLAISAHLRQVSNYSLQQSLVFFSGSLAAIFTLESLIALGASRLKPLLNDRLLRRIDVGIGLLFIALAVFLLWPLVTGRTA